MRDGDRFIQYTASRLRVITTLPYDPAMAYWLDYRLDRRDKYCPLPVLAEMTGEAAGRIGGLN